MIWTLFEEPLVQLLLLAALTAAIRRFLLKPAEPSTAAGAAVMAVGIFAIGPLPQIAPAAFVVGRLVALELLVIWVFLAASYVGSLQRGTFHFHIDDPVGCFATGTWVAGTAVLARLLDIVLPEWQVLSVALAAISVALWFWYLWLIAGRYRLLIAQPQSGRVTGRILLATVSAQSIVILGQVLFPGRIPGLLDALVIYGGYLLYALGVALIVRRYAAETDWSLADDWDNTNCILHGALSISGLAAVQTRVLPDLAITGTWFLALSLLVIVEGLELVRLVDRVRQYGWRQGVFTYQVSQWARNFTFGMFYTFTLGLRSAGIADYRGGATWLAPLQQGILDWGQYVVLLILLLELGLYLAQNVSLARLAIHSQPADNVTGQRNA